MTSTAFTRHNDSRGHRKLCDAVFFRRNSAHSRANGAKEVSGRHGQAPDRWTPALLGLAGGLLYGLQDALTRVCGMRLTGE
ncbi:hypothetical protein ABZZ85_31665, partial [Streptomyces halstedii]